MEKESNQHKWLACWKKISEAEYEGAMVSKEKRF